MRQKAVERGIIDASYKPSQKELFDYLFLPGFSTSQSVTEVSGRGVGMDVVKKKIESLRGEIIVSSEPGKGSSFTLKMQQSLAIIDTLLFRLGNVNFIVPLSDIEICTQISLQDLERHKHTSTIPHNENMIYFFNLRTLFNIKGSYGKKIKVIILRKNKEQIAVLSDFIVGEHQAVLKPLGKVFKNQQFLNSASQLGDGSIAFMIDINALFKDCEENQKVNITGS